MNTIIAGSRICTNSSLLTLAIKRSGFEITKVFCGGARGADKLGEQWAQKNKIPITMFPANWKRYKNFAGNIRNIEMAKDADALIALWDGKSSGTKHMIDTAKKHNLAIYIKLIPLLADQRTKTVKPTGFVY